MPRKSLEIPPRKKVLIVLEGSEKKRLENAAKSAGVKLVAIEETGTCHIEGTKGRFRFEARINTSKLHAEVTLEGYNTPDLDKSVTDAMCARKNERDRFGAACRALRDQPLAKWVKILQRHEQAKIDSAEKEMKRHRRKLKDIERTFGFGDSSRKVEVRKRSAGPRRRRARKRIPADPSPRSK